MRLRPPTVVIAGLLALLLAACGGSSSTEPQSDAADHGGGHAEAESTAPPVDGATEVTVTAVDIDFEPDAIEIVAGEPVNLTVVNDGEALHDFTLEVADIHMNVPPGESRTTSLTIDEPGHYEAKCTVAGHAEAGMTIDVTVVEG